MKSRNRIPVLLVPLLLVGSACSHTIPASQVKPTPPPQFNAPQFTSAPASAQALPGTQPPESVLPITLTADLTPIQRAIEAAVPERFTDADHPLGSEYRWAFVRDGEPTVTIVDGMVTIHASYRGDIEARGSSRGCHLDPLYPVLDGTGKLTLRQEEDALAFALEDTKMIMELKPESDSKCNMFNIPVKDQLHEIMHHEAVKKQIANAVTEAGVKIPVQQVGERLHGPMAVSVLALNTKLCMYGKPSEVIIGSMRGTAQHTTLSGIARETPSAMYETVCRQDARPSFKVHSGPAEAEGRPYKILGSIPVPYATLTQVMQDKLFHTEVPLDTMLNDKLVIERVTAADASGRALISVQTSGPVKGTIYYWGTPQFTDGGTALAVPDLQMATESKTALDTIKVGYWQTIDRGLKDRIRKAATIDLTQYIGKMKSAMNGQHKMGNLTMDIDVARQRAERAYSTPQGLVADIIFEGAASATGGLALESGQEAPPSGPATSKRSPAAM